NPVAPGQLPQLESRARSDQSAGGQIPGLESSLVIGVIASTRAPGQIERRGTHTTDVAHARKNPCHHFCLARAQFRVVSEPRGDHRGLEVLPLGSTYRRAVQGGLARPRRRKAFLPRRVEHHARHYPGRILTSDADGKRRDPEQKVDRPVERIDQPAQLSLARGAAFLAEYRVAWTALSQHRADG